MELHDLADQTRALSSWGAELYCIRHTQLRNRPMNVVMSCAAVSELHCSERFGTVRKAVTGRSMSSLGHLMMRGGMQILYCAARCLSGSVIIYQSVLYNKTLHSHPRWHKMHSECGSLTLRVKMQISNPLAMRFLICKNQITCGRIK